MAVIDAVIVVIIVAVIIVAVVIVVAVIVVIIFDVITGVLWRDAMSTVKGGVINWVLCREVLLTKFDQGRFY